uniref:Membrane-bound O-acyltransferase domain-containing protein 2-like n=1 Tax=Phallusia mammillata TaxID=59560 RepID=A0A6F9DKV9_9ASCI|nr:membrane-bound O-acyltransferase domain-containing protein 2-like [Phallusia mammillata]
MGIVLNAINTAVEFTIGMRMPEGHLVFLVGLFSSLAGSYFFKHFINKPTVSRDFQLTFTCVYGLWLFCFCWGWNIIFPICDVVLSYILLKVLPSKIAHKVVFVSALSFLSVCHIKNVVAKYTTSSITAYAADFTGPVMILTQKITSLAFGLHDGNTKSDDEMTPNQKQHVLRKMPSFLEYFAYMFNCFGILAAPFIFYDDFMGLIDEGCNKESQNTPRPSSALAVISKVAAALIILALFLIGDENIRCDLIADDEFIATTSIFYRAVFIYITLLIARAKYYGVWLLSDATYNAAGLGFGGFTELGRPKWDKVSNIHIINIEFATGMKNYIDNWNIRTLMWIRYLAYERLDRNLATMGAFALSAVWHGFLPGYYLMFFTCHIFLTVQRKFRRTVRPHFQHAQASRMLYDVFTFCATQLAIMYGVVPFVLLEWSTSIKFYRSVWFIGHIIGVGLLLIIPNTKSTSKTSDADATKPSQYSSVNRSEKLMTSQFASHRNGHYDVRHR